MYFIFHKIYKTSRENVSTRPQVLSPDHRSQIDTFVLIISIRWNKNCEPYRKSNTLEIRVRARARDDSVVWRPRGDDRGRSDPFIKRKLTAGKGTEEEGGAIGIDVDVDLSVRSSKLAASRGTDWRFTSVPRAFRGPFVIYQGSLRSAGEVGIGNKVARCLTHIAA